MLMRPTLLSLAILAFGSAGATAQESSETDVGCGQVMDAAVAAGVTTTTVGEGTRFDRSTMVIRSELGGYAGTIHYFEGEDQVQEKVTHYICDGRRLLIRYSAITVITGVGGRQTSYDPPLVAAILPLTEGESWAWQGTMNVTTADFVDAWPAMQTGSVIGTETVETPVGSFETSRVLYVMSVTNAAGEVVLSHDSWFTTDPSMLEIRSSTTNGEHRETWALESLTGGEQ